jgi:hypothetical protein
MSDSITKFEDMKNEIPTEAEVQKHFKNDKHVKCFRCGKYAKIISYKDTEVVVDKNEKVKLVNEERPQRYSTREVNGMDVIDLVKHWNLNFNEGNILKYLLRDKGQDISDLKKIIDYAQREIKHRESLL